MSILVDCPHCSTRVLPMAGRVCPACRKNLDAPPEISPTPEQAEEDVYGAAAEQMREGVAPSDILQTLTERGLDADAAATVVGDLEQARAMARKESARKNMLHGALWCIGGVAVTVLTYQAAAPAGGRYVVAWGAIVFGGIQFLRGLMQSAGE